MNEQRVERVRALGIEHARIETERNLSRTMATLVDDPATASSNATASRVYSSSGRRSSSGNASTEANAHFG
jgi:hypothetical protein